MSDKPVFRQTMHMHLNGGSKFSRLVYKITRDGIDTGITRITETNGSPNYLKTADDFVKGDARFDMLATNGVGMTEWLLAHSELNPPAAE